MYVGFRIWVQNLLAKKDSKEIEKKIYIYIRPNCVLQEVHRKKRKGILADKCQMAYRTILENDFPKLVCRAYLNTKS